jgi:hypothetical protein
MAAAGLTATFHATTARVDDLAVIQPDALLDAQQRELLAAGRVRGRPLNARRMDAEIELLGEMVNDSFARNPFFVPVTREEWMFLTDPYRKIVDPALVRLVELDGRPCGFVITVPDVSPLLWRLHGRAGLIQGFRYALGRRRVRTAVGTFIGVRQEVRKLGMMRVIVAEGIRALQRKGYRRLFLTWIADDNPGALAINRALAAHTLHRLAVFEGPLAEPSVSGEASTSR